MTVPATVAKPQATADMPPWLEAAEAPVAVPLRRQSRRPQPAGRAVRQAEMVHWSIAALTLFTGLSVLLGSFGGDASQPKELLPIVMMAP